jgi:hypothetical protein
MLWKRKEPAPDAGQRWSAARSSGCAPLVGPGAPSGRGERRPVVEHPGSARWQRGEVVEGFYLADSEETTWAEWYRSLAELALPPTRQMPRDLWRFGVDVEPVADLSSTDGLARVSLREPLPDPRQWPAFQAVGERLFAEGWGGVLYASAARPDSLALCLFCSGDQLPGVRRYPHQPVTTSLRRCRGAYAPEMYGRPPEDRGGSRAPRSDHPSSPSPRFRALIKASSCFILALQLGV